MKIVAESNNVELSSVAAPSSLRHKHGSVRHQIHNFAIELNPQNTIIHQHFPTFFELQNGLLSKLGMLCLILYLFDQSINDFVIHSLILSTITKLIMLITLILHILNCNLYIITQALKSFIVWYKSIHAFIGITSRLIYYHFWINDIWYVDVKAGSNATTWLYYFNGILVIINISLGVFTLCILDGLYTGASNKANNIKRLAVVVGLCVICWFWIELYFNLYTKYDPLKSFDFIFGQSLYWRSIALSSFFKAFVFLCSQLSLNLRTPNINKINVIPLPVIIKYTRYTNNSAQIAANLGAQTPSVDNNSQLSVNTHTHIHTHVTESATHEFFVSVPMEITVLFILLTKVFKINIEASLYYSQLFRKTIWLNCVLIALLIILLIIKIMLFDYLIGSVVIIIDIFILLIWIVLFLDLNFELLYFRRRSLTLIWKVYNIITLMSAIYYLRFKFERAQFNKEQFESIGESIVTFIITIFYVIIGTVSISLHQGYTLNVKWKLLIIFFYIAIVLQYMIYHYFNQNYDVNVNLLGHDISMRSIIIAKSFDLSLWFSYQLYQVYNNAHQMNLVSRVRLDWTA